MAGSESTAQEGSDKSERRAPHERTAEADTSALPTAAAEGFEPLMRSSPFLERIGPLWCRRDPDSGQLVLGMRILPHHCNVGGTAHGGLLGTLADVALGYSTAFSRQPPVPMTTVSLHLDFTGAARLGDWIEVHTAIQKIGRRLAFANARITSGSEPVAGASAVFQIQNG